MTAQYGSSYQVSDTGPVTSVFGRVGAVVAQLGDYAASLITNDSSVVGATVKDALNALLAAIPPAAPVSSVFGRVGAVVAAAGDYTSTQVTNASGVAGATVTAALNALLAAIGAVQIVSTQEGVFSGNTTTTSAYVTLLTENVTMAASQVLLFDAFSSSFNTSGALSSGVLLQIQVNGTTLTSSSQDAGPQNTQNNALVGRLAVGSGGLVVGANAITLRWRHVAGGGTSRINTANDGENARLRLIRLTA